MSSYFYKQENEGFRDWFRADEFAFLEGKLVLLFLIGLAVSYAPNGVYRALLSFDGSDYYVSYLKHCLAMSIFATYLLGRLGLFVMRLLAGRLYKGPRL